MLANGHPIPFPVGTPSGWKWRPPMHNLVQVRRGFTSTSIETSGAYPKQFIVCGGTDPNHLLSSHSDWSLPPNPPDVEPVTTVTGKCSAEPGTKRLTVGFGKLKAKRVKALVERTFRMKQEISTNDDELVAQSRQRGVSRVFLSKELRETCQSTDTEKHIENSDLSADSIQGLDKSHESYPTNAEPEGSFRGGSAAHLLGWGDGGSIHKPKMKSPELLKKHHKLSVGGDFFSRKTFIDLGCSEYMIKSLKEQLFVRPSHIQAMAFRPVLEGQSCIIADQSGSGKTLAYLIPVIQRLREEELQGFSKSSSGSPRAVIIVPTAELASQVLSSCRSMSKFGVPFRSMVVTGGFRQKTQLENLEQGVDVLIATPGRFMFLIKEGFLQLANLRTAVFDEVDILFNDEDFKVALQSLIDSSPIITQYLFVTATLPVDIYNKLIEVFPDTKMIMGPGMHHISSGLEEVLVDCSGEGTLKTPDTAFLNKKNALLKLVEESPVCKTIVFCNKIDTCRKVENVLKRFDRRGTHVRVLPFHAALAQETRIVNMKEFTQSHPGGESLILVCTDRASRGIDFAGVDHVVLFDFPRDPSEYVRRVGRTARGAGGKGKAFIFVVGKQVPLARRIIERNQKGHPLHDVPSAFELMR
ncbi:PREDICTED: DEAD-box ATP-dependent RNA helicase 50 [Theobroma cacao]|uniref:DEA(D/H)-box RNA helicase family protein n=2 Tax=Theobroma cacao TaxID=3641 RepID=A0A061FJ68_THECC|nr:PREDICTED: DEAD-box ATP-dependent RNA helicase 50 [Theobroma cacao]EOY16963.1 DEA(D/H)-box RNA helicase family protein [Theobroma cacao]